MFGVPKRGSCMRAPLHVEEAAVSPVIGTILLVAITVILAGVLYVMVAGILRPTDNAPRLMGIALEKSGDGKNWTLTVVSTPVGLSPSNILVSIFAPNGTRALLGGLSALSYEADGAAFTGTGPSIAVGDRLLVNALRYPDYYQVQISDATAIYYSATFP